MNDTNEQQQQVVYVKAQGNGAAVAALITGLIGLVFGLAMFVLFPIAWAFGVAAIVCGIIGRNKAKNDPQAGRKTMATWGLWLGIASIALGCIGAVVVNDAVEDINQSVQEIEQINEDFENDPCLNGDYTAC